MTSRLYKYGVLTLLLLASAADNSVGQPVEVPVSWDDYRVVVERNIFSRDRGRAVGVPDPLIGTLGAPS